MLERETKEINVCFDLDGEVKCATSYDKWCSTCVNEEKRVKKELILHKKTCECKCKHK